MVTQRALREHEVLEESQGSLDQLAGVCRYGARMEVGL